LRISETEATPGYRPCPLLPREWQIILGAHKVALEGVTVTYELTSECDYNKTRCRVGSAGVETPAQYMKALRAVAESDLSDFHVLRQDFSPPEL
jgi:hypothetical protein